jgi:hypothetical protein
MMMRNHVRTAKSLKTRNTITAPRMAQTDAIALGTNFEPLVVNL